MRMVTRLAICLFSAAAAAPVAVGASLPSTFTLGKLIPGDVWMYVHVVRNPEAEWIHTQWEGVFDALHKSGVEKDLMALVASAFPSDQSDSIGETIDRLTALVKHVRWSDLAGSEFTFAVRFNSGHLVPYDYFVLSRCAPETAEENFAALAALFQELASLGSKSAILSLSERRIHNVHVWSLAVGVQGTQASGVSLHLIRKGDVIGLLIGPDALKDVLSLLGSDSKNATVVQSARFTNALSQVSAPEDMVGFFDIKRFVRGIGSLMKCYSDDAGDDTLQVRPGAALASSVLKIFDFADYGIKTVETDGRRQISHTYILLQDDWMKSPIAASLMDRTPFDRFDQYIPEDALGFSANGFINIQHLYNAAIAFVKTEVDGGAEKITKFNATIEQFGFDPQRDLFSWFSGEYITLTLPPAVVTPMSSEDRVLFLRVTDAKIAREKTLAALRWLQTFLARDGQSPLIIAPAADVRAEGFVEVIHPMVAMFVKPVIGVHKNWLVVASSTAAVNKCLDVESGKSPSINKNKRYLAEGLRNRGPVRSVSFADKSKFGRELAQLASQIGMFGGFATMNIPDASVREVVGKLLNVAMKLGPVLQKIDFYSSEASMSTIDGLEIREEMIVTYKPPKSEEAKTASRTPSTP